MSECPGEECRETSREERRIVIHIYWNRTTDWSKDGQNVWKEETVKLKAANFSPNYLCVFHSKSGLRIVSPFSLHRGQGRKVIYTEVSFTIEWTHHRVKAAALIWPLHRPKCGYDCAYFGPLETLKLDEIPIEQDAPQGLGGGGVVSCPVSQP